MNHWYVIKTKPKKEETVVAQLQRASFEVFLPKMRAASYFKPLFPSYFFIYTSLEDPRTHRLIRFTRGVSKILGDMGGPQPISDLIIETLQERTKDSSLIEQELLFKEGEEITVKRGILKDLSGIIEKNISDSGRVKVLFKWLNGSMRAVLKYTDLEKAA